MRVLILGGDGYLGWPQALHFSARGHEVAIFDNGVRRRYDTELGLAPLALIPRLWERVEAWKRLTGLEIEVYEGDLSRYEHVLVALSAFGPEVIVHFAEQRSAPYSHIDARHALYTQENNVLGTLGLLWGMRECCRDAILVKLGTMGEYGTPNIDIEEGYIDLVHKGRRDILPYPMQPGSFYHATKAFDSINIRLACRIWGLRAVNLNQGPVYGVETPETTIGAGLHTRFDYDHVFGTVINRFCVQAAIGHPLTVYGSGGQTRGYIDIRDTMACIELAAMCPPERGRMEVMNQITEQFSVNQLAEMVQAAAKRELGIEVEVQHLPNPRVEAEEHYYNVAHTKLPALGLSPHRLEDEVGGMVKMAARHADNVRRDTIFPSIAWQ